MQCVMVSMEEFIYERLAVVEDLSNAKEMLTAWATACEIGFQEKANPPSKEYFFRHFYQDGDTIEAITNNVRGIYVCKDSHSKQLVKLF